MTVLSKQENDVVVTAQGKLGIDIVSPQNTLHIKTSISGNGFRLAEGTEGEGKLLSSINTEGDITWKNRLSTKNITADGSGYSGSVSSDMQYIQRKVSLEPGKWLIRTNLLLYTHTDGHLNKGFYAHFSWSEFDGTNYSLTTDAIYGNDFGGVYVLRYGIATGSTLINNTSASEKTYYLVTRTPTFWGGYNVNATWGAIGGSWGETSIIAFPAD